MHVDLIAWAMNQALPAEQQAILALMALFAAEAGTRVYLGNLTALAVCSHQPIALVRLSVDRLEGLGLIVPFNHGYRLEAGRLAA